MYNSEKFKATIAKSLSTCTKKFRIGCRPRESRYLTPWVQNSYSAPEPAYAPHASIRSERNRSTGSRASDRVNRQRKKAACDVKIRLGAIPCRTHQPEARAHRRRNKAACDITFGQKLNLLAPSTTNG
jgi:hypothetical protein